MTRAPQTGGTARLPGRLQAGPAAGTSPAAGACAHRGLHRHEPPDEIPQRRTGPYGGSRRRDPSRGSRPDVERSPCLAGDRHRRGIRKGLFRDPPRAPSQRPSRRPPGGNGVERARGWDGPPRARWISRRPIRVDPRRISSRRRRDAREARPSRSRRRYLRGTLFWTKAAGLRGSGQGDRHSTDLAR